MFIPQNAVFSRFQLIPNMKPHDFGISALRIFSAAWKPWSASSPFPAPSGPPWLQTLASWFWTDKVIGSPESNKMMWICLIGFQQNSSHVFTNYYYSTIPDFLCFDRKLNESSGACAKGRVVTSTLSPSILLIRRPSTLSPSCNGICSGLGQ